ncbi:DDB1- and CUL4-associated factor 11-like [Notothenia coriiceps]|uniref:DDB1- and CUL4-associated factor 11-like n=1 Tax=Notothenia coriiceps TaxID=8208 RepID=A0A6I9MLS9_9TELE|nr:PREDICTED: DDB1- and CUL4-associated factor 11-like [Notothenia coriiceps]
MGSQSSSGMSGGRGSSSGNPAEQSDAAEPNQSSSSSSSSSSRGRRTADRQQGDRPAASEEDVDLAEVLAYLLRRGQVRLVHGSGATGLQLVQSYSDSDEDSDGAWEGRLGDRYNPPGNLPLTLFTVKADQRVGPHLLHADDREREGALLAPWSKRP